MGASKGAGNAVKREVKADGPECMVCGQQAEFCMRGIPKNTYCKECAEAYFQMLDYLDTLGSR